MPRASGAAPATPAAFTAADAFSTAPTFAPIGLPAFGTPRLKEPMSRRKRFRYWLPMGAPKVGAGAVSVAISPAAGGDVKSLVLTVHLPPTWHAAQPAWVNRLRPWLIRDLDRRLPTPRRVKAPRGVRTAR